jgi:hypothetical protein
MNRRILTLALLSAALVLAVAAPAAARNPLQSLLHSSPLGTEVGAPVNPEVGSRTGFGLDPPGPYEVRVETAGEAVVVSVVRGSRQRRVVSHYLARGVATPGRLQATFGRFGRISMRFRESRHRPWFGKRRRCRGAGRFVVRRGVFVGSFRFRGEGGYLGVRAHRAKGSTTTVASKCRRRNRAYARSSPFEDSISGLVAGDRDGVNSTAFAAISFRGKLFYFAEREEGRGKLGILRTALVRSHGDLPLNEAVTTGRFSPDAPFHGTGRYRAAPDGSTTWSGNLSVDFPGAADFPLTGPTYETFLEAGF